MTPSNDNSVYVVDCKYTVPHNNGMNLCRPLSASGTSPLLSNCLFIL